MAQWTLESLRMPGPLVAQIRMLGVDSAEGLRSMIEAAPEDLKRFLGADAFQQALAALDAVPGDAPPIDVRPRGVVHGARLEQPPRSVGPHVNLELRDRLFEELQELRSDPAGQRGDRVRDLEARLNALLDGSTKG